MSALIRPGIGPQNWVSRTNYPALNLVQTGATEMSLYVNQDYGQPTARLRRYSFRIDGLASVSAPYEGGGLLTKVLTFEGRPIGDQLCHLGGWFYQGRDASCRRPGVAGLFLERITGADR